MRQLARQIPTRYDVPLAWFFAPGCEQEHDCAEIVGVDLYLHLVQQFIDSGGLWKRRAQSLHRLGHALLLVIDGRTRYQQIRARFNDEWHSCFVHPSVDLYVAMQAALVDGLARPGDLRQRLWNQFLPSKARVNGHNQEHIDQREHVFKHEDGCGGVERHSDLFACLADLLHHAVQVRTDLVVDDNEVRTGFCKGLDVLLRNCHGKTIHTQPGVEQQVRLRAR